MRRRLARLLVAVALVCVAAAPAATQPAARPPEPASATPLEDHRSLARADLVRWRAGPSRQVVDGLRFEHHARWDVDPAVPTVRVRHELRLTNTAPDQVVPGGIRYMYFPEIVVPVPVGATGVAATGSGGTPIPAHLEATESPFAALAVVDLIPDLRYGDTQDVVLTYELPATGPRSTSPVRVNAAYVGFPLLVIGDPGETSVEVRVPAPFDVEVVGDPLDGSDEGGATVLRAVLDDPDGWFASVVARNDDALRAHEVDVGEHGFIVRAWPDDPAWAEFAAGVVTDGVGVLEERIGLPWPADRTIEVLETAAVYEYGYAGWYQPLEGVIEVGDELDGQVVLHELSHLWFNSTLFRQRWINEGLAEVFSHAAAAELGLEPGDGPAAPGPIDPAAPGALPLNEWSTPRLTDEIAAEQEAFGYNAAWAVMDAIRAEVGLEGLAEVVGAAHRGESAYAGPGVEPLDASFGWTHLLDLLEDRAGATVALDLFTRHVATDEQRAQLDERAAARDRYAGHVERSAPWAPPAEVRTSMAAWQFPEAVSGMDAAEAVLDVRDRAEPVLRRAGVELDALREAYEGGTRLTAAVADAERADAAVRALADALDADARSVGILGRIGLLFRSPGDEADAAAAALASGDYAAALDRAGRTVALVEGADRAGAVRLGGAVLVLVAVGAATALVRRRGRASTRGAGAEADTGSAEVRDPAR